jgi:hypothetical protein
MKLPKITLPPSSQSFGERLLTITPVALTVLATLLTGLSASEMTKAQYYRATAAQNQSKAADQWGFFQAKKLRGAGAHNAAAILQATADPASFDPVAAAATVRALSAQIAGISADQPATSAANVQSPVPQMQQAAEDLQAALSAGLADKSLVDLAAGRWPPPPPAVAFAAPVHDALAAIAEDQDEAQTTPLMVKVRDRDLDQALADARQRSAAWDQVTAPITRSVDHVGQALDSYAHLVRGLQAQASPAGASGGANLAPTYAAMGTTVRNLRNSFTAATLHLDGARYDAEARLNQTTAGLYEIWVCKSSLESEHHKARSQHFFFGALAAQVAVIGSTLALALRRHSFLWGAAAALGLAAFGFATYVYLYV